MNKIEYPIILENVLDEKTFVELYKDCINDWDFINTSYPEDPYKRTFWGKRGYDWPSLTAIDCAITIKLKLKKILKHDLKLIRINYNAQTAGQEGSFHFDSQDDGVWTFVLFLSPQWDISWGGEFICFDPFKNQYKYVPFIPNTGCLSPSKWQHRGSAPNILTDKLRISIAFTYASPESSFRFSGDSIPAKSFLGD